MRLLAPMNSAARPFTDATACVCLSSIRPQTDELVVVVAIEVRGARVPSRAVAGASPTTFLDCAREAFRRGAEIGTRGRVRSPEKRSRIPQRRLNYTKARELTRPLFASLPLWAPLFRSRPR